MITETPRQLEPSEVRTTNQLPARAVQRSRVAMSTCRMVGFGERRTSATAVVLEVRLEFDRRDTPMTRSFKVKLYLPPSRLFKGMLLLLLPWLSAPISPNGFFSPAAAPVEKTRILGLPQNQKVARRSRRM